MNSREALESTKNINFECVKAVLCGSRMSQNFMSAKKHMSTQNMTANDDPLNVTLLKNVNLFHESLEKSLYRAT